MVSDWLSVSTPPLAVPPSSATVQPNVAGPPQASAVAWNCIPRSWASVYVLLAVTAVVPSASTIWPRLAAGTAVTVYVRLWPLSSAPPPTLYVSPARPKLVVPESSRTVKSATAPAVRTGWSLTGVTVIVSDWLSVSTPPLAVPPSSDTVQPNVAGPPMASAAAWNCIP